MTTEEDGDELAEVVEVVGFAVAETPESCAAMGLRWRPGGYALLLCRNSDGSKVTRIGGDVEYLRLMEAAGGLEVDVPHRKFPLAKAGWVTLPGSTT